VSQPDTARRLFRSSGAATFSQVWRAGVTLLVYILLRRILPREDWGLFEWALAVFLILGALRDLGLIYHVIRVEPRPYANLLAVEGGWGLTLAGLTVLGAPLLGLALTDPHPEKLDVIRVMSLFLLFEGLAMVPKTYFDAELLVGRTVLPEIVRNLIYASLSLTLALAGFGVWSLVVAQVVCTAYYAAHLWVRAWGRIPLEWQRDQTASLLWRSLPLATIWFLAIFVQYVDPLILGLRFDTTTIGEYGFAYKFAFLATAIVVPAITRTIYPALVALKAEPGRLMEAYRLGTLFVLGIEVPAAAFLFANPEILTLISSQYVMADSFLVILCFAPLVDPFSRLGGEVIKAYHLDRIWILSVALTLASFAVFGYLLTGRYGPIGMAWANFLQLGMLPMAWAIRRLAPGPFRRLVRDLLVVYAVPAVPFLALKLLLPDQSWTRIALSLAAAGGVLIAYYSLFGRSFLDFARSATVADGHPAGRDRTS
jgi:PST family polysaccharide transporter